MGNDYEELDLRLKETGSPDTLNCDVFGSFCYGYTVWHKCDNPLAQEIKMLPLGIPPVAPAGADFMKASYVTGVEPATPTCGFGGGCQLKLNGSHLHTHVSKGLTTIKMCGRQCTYVAQAMDPTWTYPFNLGTAETDFVVCSVPPVQTKQTINWMKAFEDAEFAGTGVDSVFTVNPSPALYGFAAVCKQVDAAAGNVGMLTQLKFKIDTFTSARSDYAGKLFLEASDDFSISTSTFAAIGDEIHEGYNTYTDDSWSLDIKMSYRLVSTLASGCTDLSEIQFIG